jgi:hypothetical protein
MLSTRWASKSCFVVLISLHCGGAITSAGTGDDANDRAAQPDVGWVRSADGRLSEDAALGAIYPPAVRHEGADTQPDSDWALSTSTDGTLSEDATPADICPAAIPEAGAFCSLPRLACPYPTGDEQATPFAICVDDNLHPPSWQVIYQVDKRLCPSANKAGILLETDGGLACTDRPASPCILVGANSPQLRLDHELFSIIEGCGAVPNETFFEVEYRDGCPTKMIVTNISRLPLNLSCIVAALSSERSRCAIGLQCAETAWSTLQ